MNPEARETVAQASLDLVPLDCPSCGAAVLAAGEDVVFYCTACRNGYSYQEEEPRLSPLDVHFVAAANLAAERYLPFWVLEAKVDIDDRQAGHGVVGLMQDFFGRGYEGRGDNPGAFVVPAFRADLDATVELVHRYSAALPTLSERLGEKLTGGCFGVEDAKKLVHFAVIAGEVDRPDTLKNLDYSISFGGARLLGVPFARDEQGYRDAIHGVRVPGLEKLP